MDNEEFSTDSPIAIVSDAAKDRTKSAHRYANALLWSKNQTQQTYSSLEPMMPRVLIPLIVSYADNLLWTQTIHEITESSSPYHFIKMPKTNQFLFETHRHLFSWRAVLVSLCLFIMHALSLLFALHPFVFFNSRPYPSKTMLTILQNPQIIRKGLKLNRSD